MENQDFTENTFIIDLSNARDNLQIINELCTLLEMTESKGKNICLKLRDIEMSQSQLLGIKALIDATGSTLAFIDVNTEKTVASANELGITVSTINNNLQIEERVQEETKNEEFTNEENSSENTENHENTEYSEYSENSETHENNENNENSQEGQEIQGENEIVLPSFIAEQEQPAEKNIVSEIPASYELFPSQNLIESPDVPYEIFKTEDMSDENNNELPTLYLRQTLRSGQTLSYDGNILVIGDTHPGSELIAKGDITVWGVLAGIAHAGTSGDKKARIRALKLNAIQLRIAGIYAARKNTENIPYIQRSSEFTPQEASIENDVLVIRNINNYEL